ncbi:hypothetical protein [Thiomicrospira microaerophila]|uniref:hypothetical protein n=1 Tax=Thiomicrospira microaerophila TaxID=406020 RepID=UPI000AC3415D|nr:hypothetical protein [Thiomicrospira microaerophila]
MSKYKPYPAYKDSGIEWLGEVPEHWLSINLGRLFRRIKRTGFEDRELSRMSTSNSPRDLFEDTLLPLRTFTISQSPLYEFDHKK